MKESDYLLVNWLEVAPNRIGGYYKTTGYKYIHSKKAVFEVWVKGIQQVGPDEFDDYDDALYYEFNGVNFKRIDYEDYEKGGCNE